MGEAETKGKLDEMGRMQRQAAGKRNLQRGALWFIGGCLVTGVTYFMAAGNHGGNTYVVAWGAIIIGAFRILQGWYQLSSKTP